MGGVIFLRRLGGTPSGGPKVDELILFRVPLLRVSVLVRLGLCNELPTKGLQRTKRAVCMFTGREYKVSRTEVYGVTS